jgi:hypothetical protein
MTDNEFTLGLLADPMHTKDGSNRIRYIIADALSKKAGECRKAGRPDKCGVLNAAASALNGGKPVPKGVKAKARKEIEEVRAALVDGVEIGLYPHQAYEQFVKLRDGASSGDEA